jgi:O-antigen ligase
MLERTLGKYVSERSIWAMIAAVTLTVGAAVSFSLYGGIALGVLVLFVLALPFLLRDPRYLLYTFAFTLPFGETAIGGGDAPVGVTLSNIQLLLLTVLLPVRFLRDVLSDGKLRVAKPYKPYVVALSLILIADVISVLFHPAGARFLVTRMSLILTFLVGVVFIDSPRTMRAALRCLAIGLVMASALTVLHSLGYTGFGHTTVVPAGRIVGWRSPLPRTIGIPGINFGLYGLFMISMFPLALISFFKKSPLFRSRLFSATWIVLVALGLFIGQSRSAWLGLIASTFVVVLLLRGDRRANTNSARYLTVLLTVGTVLLTVLGLLLLWEDLPQLGSSLVNSLVRMRRIGITERLVEIEFAWSMLTKRLESFLFGYGYLQFDDMYASAYPDARTFVLHNHYMEHFFGSGISGLFSYGLLLLVALCAFYAVAREGQGLERLWGIGLLAGFVGMLVTLLFFGRMSGMKLLWLMVALAQRTHHFSNCKTAIPVAPVS